MAGEVVCLKIGNWLSTRLLIVFIFKIRGKLCPCTDKYIICKRKEKENIIIKYKEDKITKYNVLWKIYRLRVYQRWQNNIEETKHGTPSNIQYKEYIKCFYIHKSKKNRIALNQIFKFLILI